MAKAATLPVFTSGFRLHTGEAFQTLSDCFSGAQAVPSGSQSQAGASSASFAESGNLNVQSSAAGVANAAATTDTVLFTYAMPASVFDVANREVAILAAGKFGATGNNKRVQIYIGPDVQTVGNAIVTTGTTSIASSGTQTSNAGGWIAQALVVKYGAAGANTQLGINLGVQAGTAHLGTTAPVALTLTENAIIYITVTGASQTSGAASDVLAQLLMVSYSN